MTAFLDSLDIGNRALDHLGLPHILAVDENSTRNSAISNAYDKLREAELRRNIWLFAKRRGTLRPLDSTARLLSPDVWTANETYLPGSIVADGNGDLWISWKADNYGFEPGISDVWDAYYGPMSVHLYASGTSYDGGELVYKDGADGSFVIFLSLAVGNSDNPSTTTAWSATTTYGLNDRVYSGAAMWRSLLTLNTGVTPADAPNAYNSGVTYAAAARVTASNGFTYTAVGTTTGVDPIDDDGTFWTKGVAAGWSRTPALYSASPKWLPLFAGMTNFGAEYLYISGGRNIFRVPSGFLRRARQGYRQVHAADDNEPIGSYIVSGSSLLNIDFIASIRDVRKFDPMFCEAFAVRLAMGVCEKLTQSRSKLSDLAAEYTKFMIEARAVNGIELGPEEADEDEWLTVQRGGNGGFSNASTNWWNS